MFSHKGFHDEKPDVSELVSNSLAQARSLSEQRFNFVKLMEADWRKFANGRREFEESTQATIEALKCHGYSKEANEYAARVYQPEIVSNPGRFTIHWSTGYGLERMTMIFEGREYDDPSLASGETSTSLPEVSSDFLSLAEPVDIEFTPKETLPIEAVWQWICWSTSGFAFCLDCPCGPMAVPSLYITGQAPTHRLIRRVSYLNPFENDNAIKHFRKAHHLDLSIEELLRKYGRQGTCAYHQLCALLINVVIAPGLSRWDIAAHNYSIQHVHLRLSHEAERSFASDQVQHPLKTVDELSVAESRATVYQYGGHSWVVLCPDLDCHLGFFETNPFNRGRGFEHFRAHGLRITTNRELAERFGYQGRFLLCCNSSILVNDWTQSSTALGQRHLTRLVQTQQAHHSKTLSAQHIELRRRQ